VLSKVNILSHFFPFEFWKRFNFSAICWDLQILANGCGGVAKNWMDYVSGKCRREENQGFGSMLWNPAFGTAGKSN